MKRKGFLALSLLLLLGMVGGCHYGSYDDHRWYGSGYGYGSSGSSSYREGFRDGRAYERRRDGLNYSRYDDRYWR